MEKIDGVELDTLVEEASAQYLKELRDEGVSIVKRLFQKVAVLSGEIKRDKVALLKKEKSLEDAQNIIEKIKAGDWSALVSKEQN